MARQTKRRSDLILSDRKYDPQDINIDRNLLDNIPIKGQLNVEGLVFRQIERTCVSALQDESLFASNVRLLLSTVPTHKRKEILEKTDEYTSTTETWQYKYFCGVPLGTVEHPINGSPVLTEEEIIDWHKLFEIILTVFEDCGLTWKRDSWTIEVGKEEDIKSLPPPTPVFIDTFKNPNLTGQPKSNLPTSVLDAPQKYARPCAICGQHVGPGTGCFYKRKIVHKKECLDLAKTRWTD